jgi:hypothetical protein
MTLSQEWQWALLVVAHAPLLGVLIIGIPLLARCRQHDRRPTQSARAGLAVVVGSLVTATVGYQTAFLVIPRFPGTAGSMKAALYYGAVGVGSCSGVAIGLWLLIRAVLLAIAGRTAESSGDE